MADLFVLLPAHLDAGRHFEGYRKGLSADSSPWGLAHAARFGHSVAFSTGRESGALERLIRRVVGFDLMHAWTNRKAMACADVILTHTEREYLGAAFALLISGAKRPILQANTLWLFSEWPAYAAWRRAFLRLLLRRVDIFTCNAAPNIEGGQALGCSPVHYVPYGISTDSFPITAPRGRDGALVVSIGVDRSRDWASVREVATGCPGVRVRVATRSPPPPLVGLSNVEIRAAAGPSEAMEIYDSAALALVCVFENRHASGITVILEAVARGTPVVCSDQGGLDAYFNDEEVCFYGEKRRYRTAQEAVSACLADPTQARRRAEKAQARFRRDRYDSVAFVERLLTAIAVSAQSVAKSRSEAAEALRGEAAQRANSPPRQGGPLPVSQAFVDSGA